MISMIIVLAFVSVYLEIKVVTNTKFLGKLLEQSKLMALCFSFGLSFVLGSIFGATGLIVFTAALLSTALIQPWYRARKARVFETIAAEYRTRKEVIVKRTRQTRRILRGTAFVITIPFKVGFFISDLTEEIANTIKKGFKHNG